MRDGDDLFGTYPEQPEPSDERALCYVEAVRICSNRTEESVRSQIGALLKLHPAGVLLGKLRQSEGKTDPLTYCRSLLRKPIGTAGREAYLQRLRNGE